MELRKPGEGIVFSRKSSDFCLRRDHGAWHALILMIIASNAGKRRLCWSRGGFLGASGADEPWRKGLRGGERPSCDPQRGAVWPLAAKEGAGVLKAV